MIAYKLFRKRKNGTIGSLFINKRAVIQENKWLKAEAHETKGFAFRPYWHCTSKPNAPHLSEKGRVWKKVIMKDFTEFPRPKLQGGKWYLAQNIKIIE